LVSIPSAVANLFIASVTFTYLAIASAPNVPANVCKNAINLFLSVVLPKASIPVITFGNTIPLVVEVIF